MGNAQVRTSTVPRVWLKSFTRPTCHGDYLASRDVLFLKAASGIQESVFAKNTSKEHRSGLLLKL